MKSSQPPILATCLVLVLASCSADAQGPESAQGRGHYPPNTTQKADTEFIRFTDKKNGEGLLETAIATYEGKNGEKVELISAVHVADRSYYTRMEKLFTGYDSLLYELIKAKGTKPPRKGRKTGGSSSLVSAFQRFLRDRLELEFQLDAIDYRAKNFVHADLDAETFAKLSEEKGETLIKLMLKMALSQFNASPEEKAKTDPNMGIKMLVALFMPDSARALKYLLAQQLQNMEAVMAGLGEGEDGEGSVLLIGRNKQLMRVLRERLRKGDKRIGVFYGGAHLHDVEERIFKEIGLKRTGVRWEKAWEIRKAPKPDPKHGEKAKDKDGDTKPGSSGK